jgi:hypothetical protein
MKKVVFLWLFAVVMIAPCKKNELKAEEVNDSGLVHSDSVEEDLPIESFLVYAQSVSSNPISIYVTVKGDDIVGFSLRDNIAGFALRNNVLITFSSIELTLGDFDIFRNALEKAMEWDSIARHNDVDGFRKNIPFEISSNNVSWTTFSNGVNHTIKRDETLTLQFTFSWTPIFLEWERGALNINSNTIHTSVPGSRETFRFSTGDMRISEVELLLVNTSAEKIQEAIARGRIQKKEDEARKERTETLFN